MTTTAEGVETEEQLQILRAEGCTQVQGYLFSPPQPASEIPRLIERFGAHRPERQRAKVVPARGFERTAARSHG